MDDFDIQKSVDNYLSNFNRISPLLRTSIFYPSQKPENFDKSFTSKNFNILSEFGFIWDRFFNQFKNEQNIYRIAHYLCSINTHLDNILKYDPNNKSNILKLLNKNKSILSNVVDLDQFLDTLSEIYFAGYLCHKDYQNILQINKDLKYEDKSAKYDLAIKSNSSIYYLDIKRRGIIDFTMTNFSKKLIYWINKKLKSKLNTNVPFILVLDVSNIMIFEDVDKKEIKFMGKKIYNIITQYLDSPKTIITFPNIKYLVGIFFYSVLEATFKNAEEKYISEKDKYLTFPVISTYCVFITNYKYTYYQKEIKDISNMVIDINQRLKQDIKIIKENQPYKKF